MNETRFDDRLERQIILAEIGLEGQARISAQEARVPTEASGLLGLVASRYASRAGFAALVPGDAEDAPPFMEHAAAREVVAGSLSALREIRAAVFGASS